MIQRIYAAKLMGIPDDDDLGALTVERAGEVEACRTSFLYFLKYWIFRNRETGELCSFAHLWEGQHAFASLIQEEPWILALKAGKLGFTELECAYDGWVARFKQPNARVNVFSRNANAAQDLIGYIRFGLTHLPDWLQLPLLADEPGGDTVSSLKLEAGPDDMRTIVSYAAGPHVAIDQTATHAHVDELARMPFPEKTWSAIQSTLAPAGSCHIVTRGAGDNNFVATLWEAAEARQGQLVPFFAPWTARPGRDGAWRDGQAATLPDQQLLHFAPETAADALAGDETSEYIPPQIWDACRDQGLPEFLPGDRTPMVLGVDGAVTGDTFGVVAVTRHPDRPDHPAIRACKLWDPRIMKRPVDLDEAERFIRFLHEGGCPLSHPPSMPLEGCRDCAAGSFTVPGFNLILVVYDSFQVEQMMQRLRQALWCEPFSQMRDREIADSLMHKLALRGHLAHTGDLNLRQHVLNARAKLSKDEDSRMRMVKRSPRRKIDLAVAASMAIKRALELNL